ncbi:MAG: hypothetical protein U1F77_17855 [Kiritimatiellia bacterium]
METKDGGEIVNMDKGFLLLKNYAQRRLGGKVDEVARRMTADPRLTAADRMRLLRELESCWRFNTHRELALAASKQEPENVTLQLEAVAANLRFDAKRGAIKILLAAGHQDARETIRLLMKDHRFDQLLEEEPRVVEHLQKLAEAVESEPP